LVITLSLRLPGRRALSLERGPESIESRVPVAAVAGYPRFEPIKRFPSQRIQAPLSIRSHLHDTGFRQDAQMARNTRLVDIHPFDDVADGAFAKLHRFDDTESGRVSESLQH